MRSVLRCVGHRDLRYRHRRLICLFTDWLVTCLGKAYSSNIGRQARELMCLANLRIMIAFRRFT